MNQLQFGTLGKIVGPSDLLKAGTRQSDNLSDAAGRALQAISDAITESPEDASLREMLRQFLRALGGFNAHVDYSPKEAARRFGEEIDAIVRERQLAQAMKSSLRKGYAPQDFFRR
jgi:hypothetical protein